MHRKYEKQQKKNRSINTAGLAKEDDVDLSEVIMDIYGINKQKYKKEGERESEDESETVNVQTTHPVRMRKRSSHVSVC